MYAQWFQHKGFCTLQASSAEDGFRLAAELLPSIAIVDVGLRNGEDGLALTRRLKSNRATSRVPVVVLTGYVMGTARDAAMQAGCDTFLEKPCCPDALAEAVDELIASKRRSPRTAGRLGTGS
jgi:CheY-like chemotaxis protein